MLHKSVPLTCVTASYIDILVHCIVEKSFDYLENISWGCIHVTFFFNFPTATLRYSGQYLLEMVSLNGILSERNTITDWIEWMKNHHLLALSDRNSITYWNRLKEIA